VIEYRTLTGGVESDEKGFRGLVTPFNVWTDIGDPKRGGFKERVAPGTFAKTLQERDILFLWNHNSDKPLARTGLPEGEGHLALREDVQAGLRAECPEPVDTTYGSDLHKLTRAGVVKGMSFGFEVIKDAWTDDEGRASNASIGTQRTIHEVRLHEVSAVTFPAYTTTEFSARDAISAARGVAETRTEVPVNGSESDAGESTEAPGTETQDENAEAADSTSDDTERHAADIAVMRNILFGEYK
jgi:HK97 family phage prohead protease